MTKDPSAWWCRRGRRTHAGHCTTGPVACHVRLGDCGAIRHSAGLAVACATATPRFDEPMIDLDIYCILNEQREGDRVGQRQANHRMADRAQSLW